MERVQQFESENGRLLLGPLHENTLTHQCRYQDPSIGLHVSYMRLVYDWINPRMKQMHVEALKGNKSYQNILDKLRFAGLNLFIENVEQLEPLRGNLSELEKQQLLILDKYKRGLNSLGLDTTELDEFIQQYLTDYLDNFM